MVRRTWRFVIFGALAVGSTAVLLERTLELLEGCDRYRGCRPKRWIPPDLLRSIILPTRGVFWAIVLGTIAGAFLGFITARLTHRDNRTRDR